jgi:FAD/FMN-containing dehydrogenase/Fe-S oxidoreductase
MKYKKQADRHSAALSNLIKGEVAFDSTLRSLYSTDASAYQELPLGVVWPRDERDVQLLVGYAFKNGLSLIPRGAGTSLAGQVVGNGIVVDQSRYLNRIIQINERERWVDVEPGVVLDELNMALRPHGLFFGPETSTSNRCTIGGMVGNNSCGSRSLVYGSTRDHLLEVEGFLSNGDKVVFKALSTPQYVEALKQNNLEGQIYRELEVLLGNEEARRDIEREFPHPDIHRRNTGYAIDLMVQNQPFSDDGQPFNMCRIIAGSEGTLMFATRIRLNLIPLAANHYRLLCVHLNSLAEAVRANIIALKHCPLAVELMDKTILNLTKNNIVQQRNRFFVEGDPEALLLVELNGNSDEEVESVAQQLVGDLKKQGLGYAFPLLVGADIGKVWALRKAGLGVLSNMPGDDLPVPVIEDTAVRADDLESYLNDIATMLAKYNKSCVYYGHIGSGELHLRPVLNMKRDEDIRLFRTIAEETAHIVKKHRGSLSGEHGDGRLRGEFIPLMVGYANYERLKRVKQVFDPGNVFNPGKIIDTPPMDSHLRYSKTEQPLWSPVFRWDNVGGLLQGADKCNGSADCRKSSLIGGTMCPSFMATRQEQHTTRARANMLRLYLTGQLGSGHRQMDQVKDILDLCLMCKACKAECPSNIDVAKLKTEFLYHYGQEQGFSLRDYLFAYQHVLLSVAVRMPRIYNRLAKTTAIRKLMRNFLRIDGLPTISRFRGHTIINPKPTTQHTTVWLFVDEMTVNDEGDLGTQTIRLLQQLGYGVRLAPIAVSGRTFLSKGMLDKARGLANKNVKALWPIVTPQTPLVGIEPSAILTLRDEYSDLVDDGLVLSAKQIAQQTFTIDEFLWREMEVGNIDQVFFTDETQQIEFHAHCYQKALSNTSLTQKILSFPKNYSADEIKSGCCGMAGSFGYEVEHAPLARQIGELSLFPAVRACDLQTVVVASGASCRAHLAANTKRKALHPVEVLLNALKR